MYTSDLVEPSLGEDSREQLLTQRGAATMGFINLEKLGQCRALCRFSGEAHAMG